ncbi:MAG TPA: branched-chain amino acid ABC transporter permease [Desulfuromonadales bacterium]|nr:branched-chain amino acid ABC transporter permease [Desulfuromonadales bacterium]
MRCGDFKTSYSADMTIFESNTARVMLGLFLCLLFSLPLYTPGYVLDIVNRIGIAVIGAVGLNILTGFTGQISLGNAAFMAIGAFSCGYLGTKFNLPFYVCIPLAGLLTAFFGMFVGIPSLRIKGLYLAMATLAAHFIVEFLVVKWDSVTGGVAGLSIPVAQVGGFAFDSDRRIFYLIFTISIASVLFAKNLFRTKVGKAFVAIRDQAISAEVMGVNILKYKLLSFGISSFYVGVAGALMAYQAKIISPETFPVTVAIDYLGMIIIGGLGSILGSIYGAVFITLLPELLRLGTSALAGPFPLLVSKLAAMKELVFGLFVVIFILFEPAGMAARWHSIKNYWKLYPFSH